jgi:hypothetical protein
MNGNKQKYFLLVSFLVFITSAGIIYPKDFKGAEYRTKESYLYGRFEVRYKSTYREGVLASFFTYYDGGTGVQDWNEIDIEILGRYNNDVQFNIITPGQMDHVHHQFVNFNPHLDFHTYAIEWTPDYVAWFIDNEEVHRQTGEHIQTLVREQKIMMNIWNPAYVSWIGHWNVDALPAFAYYDWVSYYSYTPGSGNYGTDNNFTHVWTDNFDMWDQTRWDKATHTWNGNNCDFIRDNAVLQGGMLILCLTDSTNTGYADVQKPSLIWARANNDNDKILVSFTEELDQTTAENVDNYIIPNVTNYSAILLPDLKHVELSISSINPSESYNLIVLNIKDRAPVQNTTSPEAVTIVKAQPLSFPIKINVGGKATMGYLADQEWSYMKEYGYLDGTSTQWAIDIGETEEDSIYWSDRYGLVTYMIRVPNGNYNVKLMFTEKTSSESDVRVFDVFIEGNKLIDNLDIYNEVGLRTTYESNFSNIIVDDRILEIHFDAEKGYALINGIVIEQISTGLLNEPVNEAKSFTLEQNFPNPFNGSTIIRYSLPTEEDVKLRVYDVLGNLVFSDNLGLKPPGEYEYEWRARSNYEAPLSSGIYFYSIEGNNQNRVKKLVLLN